MFTHFLHTNFALFQKNNVTLQLKQFLIVIMGKLMLLLYFILSVFPADATEKRITIRAAFRRTMICANSKTPIWRQNGFKK